MTRDKALAAHLRREAVQVRHSADRPWHADVDLSGAVERLLDRAERAAS